MKDTLVGVGVAVAVVLGFLGLSQPAVNLESVKNELLSKLGAVPVLTSPVCVDNICTYHLRTAIKNTWAGGTGTTTLCAFQNTTGATTTLERFTWRNTVATGTAAQLSLATTSSAFATTSGTANTALIRSDLANGLFAIAASNQKTWSFHGSRDNDAVGPGQWVVVGAQGGPGAPDTGFQYSGECSLQLQEVK